MKRIQIALLLLLITAGINAEVVDPNPFQYLDQAFVASCKDDNAKPDAQAAAKDIGYASETACIAANLAAQKTDAETLKNLRFFTLSNIFNSRPDDEVRKLKNALNKTLNSVSRRRQLKNVVFIGNPAIIGRIDLRDFALSRNDWDVKLLGLYPYGIAYFDDTAFKADEDFIAKVTQSPQAWVRADWANQEISQPPTYYDFLRLPNNSRDFFKLVNVDEKKDIETATARRAGFRHGGVSNFNRLIDYHPLEFTGGGIEQIEGDLWRTFDVINQKDLRNFFAFPFGPAGILADDDGKSFLFDASEFIFTLPNKLDGYFLVNGQGIRIDEAITEVATDKDNVNPFIGSAPHVVVNGVSCMHCHAGGMNAFRDEIRLAAASTADFSKKELDQINFLFGSIAEMAGLRDVHNKQFVTAINTIIPKTPDVLLPATEPVFYFSRAYSGDLSVESAAVELGITKEEFKSCLLHSPALAKALSIGDFETGLITRDQWEADVGVAEVECNIGEKILFLKKAPPIQPPVKPPVVVKPPVIKPAPPKPKPLPPPVKPPPLPTGYIRIHNGMSYEIRFTIFAIPNGERIGYTLLPGHTVRTKATIPIGWEAELNGTHKAYKLLPETYYTLENDDLKKSR